MKMRPHPFGRFSLSLVLGLALSGCAAIGPPATAPHAMANGVPGTRGTSAALTGVASCDAYLASYVACHRVAHTFPAAQLDAQYQSMRMILLDDANNPQTRPWLDSRCHVLREQLRLALHGQSCSPIDASRISPETSH